MITQKRSQRNAKQPPPPPPAPVVIARGERLYEVRSRRSGRIYSGEVKPDGSILCGCLARTSCYHMPYIRRAHDLANLSDGDAVLVCEAGGEVWHTVIGADASKVYTVEVPTGFSHVFVIRCERGERKAVA